jgi:hypothetical protein
MFNDSYTIEEEGQTFIDAQDVYGGRVKTGGEFFKSIPAEAIIRRRYAKDESSVQTHLMLREDFAQRVRYRQHSKEKAGYVYAFIAISEHPDYYWVKIGHTVDLEVRLCQYTGPNTVKEVISTFTHPDRRTAEKFILKQFVRHFPRVNQEWFQVKKKRFEFAKEVFVICRDVLAV